MTPPISSLETYLRELAEIRGPGVPETSYYPPLRNLLNAIGETLSPKVRCIINLKNQGAGIPDGGLFTADLLKKNSNAEPLRGLLPDRGAIEVKATSDEAWLVADSAQVAKYWTKYGHVLVTNCRDFVMVGRDAQGKPAKLETYRLANDETTFWAAAAAHPRAAAEKHGERFVEYLKRILLHAAPIAVPETVAWFLASYARDARLRIEQQPDLPALASVRTALEEALGLKFQDAKGEHFFRSTLVQTLFYGAFSAWVLWHKEDLLRKDAFDWATSARHLRVPVLRKLFHQVTEPGQLDELNLTEVLNWATAVLNRVDRTNFFARFDERLAIQYFYEPFLEAFDPALRKQLGVWYTPTEIVQHQVSRVDTVLREELNIADGLADPRVYVLDPCCGTGTYLVEVLRTIATRLKDSLGDALFASEVKKAATNRVFGFEILPAPFVVAHLQLGLLLQSIGVPLTNKKTDRIGVYLTNALTGWEPITKPKQHLLFKEFEDERDAADHIKAEERILVILGNPPYNGYAGVAVAEERTLSDAYRTTKQAPAPQGQGLNDLYVRFFRMAEHRIVEMNHPSAGVVCFISNYSWLDGLSFTGMRERYLEAFDRIWVDCLNGDKYKTGKLTPEGAPDPSVFSTEMNPEGIQVGTAITLLVRKEEHARADAVRFRHFWGKTKRAQLLADQGQYQKLAPVLEMNLSFMPGQVASAYFTWPLLPDLFPVSFPGVKTSRDDVLVDIDRDALIKRMQQYFDPKISHHEMRRIAPGALTSTKRFQAEAVRKQLLRRGYEPDKVVRYCYRPFDVRWLYWEPETKLLDEKRSEYFSYVGKGNVWISGGQRNRKEDFYQPQFATQLADHHIVESNVGMFPLYLHTSVENATLLEKSGHKPNLSNDAASYLASIKASEEELFYHTLAVLHAPAYRAENAPALRQDWPRVPLPDSKKALLASVTLGRQIAALLDTETLVEGITTGTIRQELKRLAVVARAGGGSLNAAVGEFDVTAGWGHAGTGGVTMPGKGRLVERNPEKDEIANPLLGQTTCDVYLNTVAYWRNVPSNVWGYAIGGYHVIKKWLSYREKELLGRALKSAEAVEVTHMARRIAALLLLQPALDANYNSIKPPVRQTSVTYKRPPQALPKAAEQPGIFSKD